MADIQKSFEKQGAMAQRIEQMREHAPDAAQLALQGRVHEPEGAARTQRASPWGRVAQGGCLPSFTGCQCNYLHFFIIRGRLIDSWARGYLADA